MSHFSDSIAKSITDLIQRSRNPQFLPTVSSDNTDDLRKVYLDTFKEQSTNHSDEPEWWIQQFESAAKDIISGATQLENITGIIQSKDLTIAYNGQLYEFVNRNMITIGRYQGCDILLNSQQTSRLNAVIFLLEKEYVVIDVGSSNGIITEKRSSGKSLDFSRNKMRRALIFEADETSVLNMGTVKIAINPKECVICMERPRGKKFGCGHHVVCNICQPKITVCPVCKVKIDPNEMVSGMFEHSFVPN